ncbi:MAG: hypothetical protein HOZ81_20105 [Streptomyces sp.]|nr:hypothetical protein [Streptomyces sp.]NUS81845.1 hypothetical protein [Streptomyces sp.]
MIDNPTRFLNGLFALTDDPDSIVYDETNGHVFIVLGGLSLSLTDTSQAALDKLAKVTAQAAVDNRARLLRPVI